MTETALGQSTRRADITPMRGRTESWTPRNRTNRPGKTSHMASIEEEKASISTPHDQPRANSRINNNYCVTKLQARLLAGSPLPTETIDSRINVNYSVTKLQARLLAGSPLPTETIDTCSFLNAKPRVVLNVHTALGHSQKRELSPGSAGCYYKDCKLKSGKSFLCHSIFLCLTCNKCQKCCLKSACRGQTSKLLANLAGSGYRSENSSNAERGLLPPLSDPAKSHKVSHSHNLLCQSPQEQLPAGGITSAYRQKRSRTRPQSNISRVFQPAIFSPQAQQQMETYTRSEQAESFP